MKLPTSRLEGVRGRSSATATSYGCEDTNSESKEAVPHGLPSLSPLGQLLRMQSERVSLPELKMHFSIDSDSRNEPEVEYSIRDTGDTQ